MNLRQELIEAGAEAIDGEIGAELRAHLGHIMRKWPNTIPDISESVLDAILDKLEQEADEWFDAWTHWTDPVDGASKFVGLIEALRVQPGETKRPG